MMTSSVLPREIIRVLVADSNQTKSQLLCGALRRQRSLKIASSRADPRACLSALECDAADVLLVAHGTVDDRSGLFDLLRGVHSGYPNLAIVLLVDQCDPDLVVNSLRLGARGFFCLASSPLKSLCRCIVSVQRGQYWTNTEQMRYMVAALKSNCSVRVTNSRGQILLTPREQQTVHLVKEGLKNRDIARELSLKEDTIKKSLLRIYDKIGVSNRVELVLYAISHSQVHTGVNALSCDSTL